MRLPSIWKLKCGQLDCHHRTGLVTKCLILQNWKLNKAPRLTSWLRNYWKWLLGVEGVSQERKKNTLNGCIAFHIFDYLMWTDEEGQALIGESSSEKNYYYYCSDRSTVANFLLGPGEILQLQLISILESSVSLKKISI